MAFLRLENLEERELAPGFRARLVHSDNMTFAYWNIDAGAALPEHAHPHEQVYTLLEGEFELTVGGEARVTGHGARATGHSSHGRVFLQRRCFRPAKDSSRAIVSGWARIVSAPGPRTGPWADRADCPCAVRGCGPATRGTWPPRRWA